MEREKSRLKAKDLSQYLGKLPPQALDAEEYVLGGMMLESKGDAVRKGLEMLRSHYFYAGGHPEIFEAISTLSNSGAPVDMRAVKNHLDKTSQLEIAGGAYRLAELTSKVSSTSDIEYYSTIIIEKYLLRHLITIASGIHNDAYDNDADPFRLIEGLEKELANTNQSLPGSSGTHIKEEIKKLIDVIGKRTDENVGMTGVPSGFPQIDKITLGWQPTDLILIAARPSMGKTSLALQFALNAGIDFNIPVGIFSLEMSSFQIGLRATSITTKMNLKTLKSKKFETWDWTNFMDRTSKLSGAPIYLDDTGGLSLMELRSKARRMVSKYGVKMIILDYIQLMKGESHHKGNRENEIGSISRGCKALAKELNVPFILLSQLSRAVEQRGGAKIPMLSDLRDSGSLEQDADVVIFPWRPGYYKIDEDGEGAFVDGLTKVIFAKHRNGELAEPFLKFIPWLTAFENVEYAYQHQYQDAPRSVPVNDEGKPMMKVNPSPTIFESSSEDLPF